MLPIRDDNPRTTTPYVNTTLIVANVAVWLIGRGLPPRAVASLVWDYGLVPARWVANPVADGATLLTSMFLHGSWGHLLGNMLFLYIFGDNVEDALGHRRYLLFYLLAGLAAAAAQIGIDVASVVPMVGASGAIAGVLGAYLVLYPRAPIVVVNPVLPLWFVFGAFLVFPAWLVVGEWFVWNLLSGVSSLSTAASGGVAFFAHIGGFVLGILAIRPLMFGRARHRSQIWHGFRPTEPRLRAGEVRDGPRRDPWAW
ncbi:MAG: rhomboid family intramembrane serine protease [Myxococcales bacterium]|nr:rhomboid family intramembrane serine protease [Myxococcales bacterium]